MAQILGNAVSSPGVDGQLIPSMQEEAAEAIDNLMMPITIEMTTPEKPLPGDDRGCTRLHTIFTPSQAPALLTCHI